MARCSHGAFCRRRLRMFFKEDFLKCLRLYGKKNEKNPATNSFFERKMVPQGRHRLFPKERDGGTFP